MRKLALPNFLGFPLDPLLGSTDSPGFPGLPGSPSSPSSARRRGRRRKADTHSNVPLVPSVLVSGDFYVAFEEASGELDPRIDTVNSSSYGFALPITVKLRNEGNTGVNLRVTFEAYNADVVWKTGGEAWVSSSSQTRYVAAHSPEVLMSYVMWPKPSSFKIAARIEFVQDYSGFGPMITTFISFFGELIKDGPTTLEYHVGDGDVWSLFYEE